MKFDGNNPGRLNNQAEVTLEGGEETKPCSTELFRNMPTSAALSVAVVFGVWLRRIPTSYYVPPGASQGGARKQPEGDVLYAAVYRTLRRANHLVEQSPIVFRPFELKTKQALTSLMPCSCSWVPVSLSAPSNGAMRTEPAGPFTYGTRRPRQIEVSPATLELPLLTHPPHCLSLWL